MDVADILILPRLRLLNFPRHTIEGDEENTHPEYSDSLVETQRAIVRIVNAYPYADLDIELVHRLAYVISHPTSHYITDYSDEMAWCLHERMRCIFLWMRAPELSLGNQSSIAPFAVVFFIHCDTVLMAIGLAKAMVDFMAIHLNQVPITHSLSMVSVCYKFTNVGILGVMFFDDGLEDAYLRVLDDSREGHEGFDMFGECPVSFWPSGCPVRVREGAYESMMQQTRPLYQSRRSLRPVPFGDITNIL